MRTASTPIKRRHPNSRYNAPMTAFETTFHVGPDGKVHISVPPELTNRDVHITVEPASNGATYPPGTRPPARTMTRDEWREFLDKTAGSNPDFPDVPRPGPDAFENRDTSW